MTHSARGLASRCPGRRLVLEPSRVRVSPRGPRFYSLCLIRCLTLLEKMSGLPASASNVGTGPVWGQVLLRQEANCLASGIGGFPLSG